MLRVLRFKWTPDGGILRAPRALADVARIHGAAGARWRFHAAYVPGLSSHGVKPQTIPGRSPPVLTATVQQTLSPKDLRRCGSRTRSATLHSQTATLGSIGSVGRSPLERIPGIVAHSPAHVVVPDRTIFSATPKGLSSRACRAHARTCTVNPEVTSTNAEEERGPPAVPGIPCRSRGFSGSSRR